MKQYKLWFITAIIVMAVFTGSGWIYNALDNRSIASDEELEGLKESFIQSYGDQVEIKQLVSPERIYAALCEDQEGNQFISWNVGGFWVTVLTSQ